MMAAGAGSLDVLAAVAAIIFAAPDPVQRGTLAGLFLFGGPH
jgi:hypothetical protein